MGEILDRLDKERMGMVENKKNDVCRCIARVYRWGALRPHRCSNPVWKDGYCKTHLTSPIKGVIIPKEKEASHESK